MAEHDDTSAVLAEQVERLRLVVEDLQAASAAQRADDAGADRWQARLSSLETRLSMVESTFRSEVERVQGALRSVEALGDGLRAALEGVEAVTAVGATLDDRIRSLDAAITANRPDTTALAAEVGRRVEEVTQAPAKAMTDALAEHLERTADRERVVASALDSLTGQLNQFTSTLAGEIRRAGQDSADASRAELAAAVRALAEAADTVTRSGEVSPRVDLAIAEIGEVRQEITAATARTAAAVAQQVREALADRLAAGDPTPVLEAMRADLRHAIRTIGEDRAPTVELHAAVGALSADIAALGDRLEALRARTEGNSVDLAGLADVPAALAKLTADLEPLASLPASMDGLGGAVEGAVTIHRRSVEAVEGLQQAIDAARAEVGAAAGATQHLTERFEGATAAAAEANRSALEAAIAQQRALDAERAEAHDERETTRFDAQERRLVELAVAIERAVGEQRDLASRVGELLEKPEPPAPLTRPQLDDALRVLRSELTDGPALPTVADLEAAVSRIETQLAAVPPPMSTADLDAAVASVRLAVSSLPEPLTLDEIAAAVRVTLPELPATRSDVEGVVARILTAVDARLAGNVVEEFRAEVNRVVEFRAEMLNVIADLRKRSPAAAATGDDVQEAAEGIAGAVRDALAGAVGQLRGDLGSLHQALDRLDALQLLVARPDTTEQLDAIGRLVHHAIRSLHVIEESTVGVSSGSVRARTEIAAALDDLEAARRDRAASAVR